VEQKNDETIKESTVLKEDNRDNNNNNDKERDPISPPNLQPMMITHINNLFNVNIPLQSMPNPFKKDLRVEQPPQENKELKAEDVLR